MALIINSLGEFVEPYEPRPMLKLGQSRNPMTVPPQQKRPRAASRRMAPLKPKRCDVCGREFVPKRCNQKRCSPECTRKSRNDRSRWGTGKGTADGQNGPQEGSQRP